MQAEVDGNRRSDRKADNSIGFGTFHFLNDAQSDAPAVFIDRLRDAGFTAEQLVIVKAALTECGLQIVPACADDFSAQD